MATAPFRVGILMCDHLPGDLRAVAGGDLDVLHRRLLDGDDPPRSFRAHDATTGDLPSLDEADGWLITGSRADAHADEPWILDLLEWIRGAAAVQERIVGVCFGHQAIARALGGTVEPAGFWAAGPKRLDLEATPWYPATTVHLNAMHRDVVTHLPPDATLAGRGETGAIPAFRVGEHILCVQDHPEYGAPVIEAIIGGRRDRLGPAVAESALARLRSIPTDGPLVGRYLTDMLLDRRR